jgi:uncharacterized flavoprotein (TIGR03862 family)
MDILKKNTNFNLYLRHIFIGIDKDLNVAFDQVSSQADKVILAMGGASWTKTGSDGKWKEVLESNKIKVNDFLPMNCGFDADWSKYFIQKIDRHPLKNITVSHEGNAVRGEVMITPFGIEGGGVYALSHLIRDHILEHGWAEIQLDLKPDLKIDEIVNRLENRKPKTSLSNHLRKAFAFDNKIMILLKELIINEDLEKYEVLARAIKSLPIKLISTRPIDEAISTSGGVCFSGLTDGLELKELKSVYIAGEMLDYEAPTGGYLLQGCFSSAWRVVTDIIKI